MPELSADDVFKALSDGTRRALFERLCRNGAQTVGDLTANSGVSQPAVSKHLAILKRAGLALDRHEGRHTRYSARVENLAPLIGWAHEMTRFLDRPLRRPRRPAQEDGSMSDTQSVVVEREFAHPPEKLWRALTQPHLLEAWLMKNDFAAAPGHRFKLRGDWGGVIDGEVLAVEPHRTLSYAWDFRERQSRAGPAQRRDVHADADALGHAVAHGAGRLPPRAETGPRRRAVRLGAVPRPARRGFAKRLKEVDVFLGKPLRQWHRWLGIVFTATVAANFLARIWGEPPAWITYCAAGALVPAAVHRTLSVRPALSRPAREPSTRCLDLLPPPRVEIDAEQRRRAGCASAAE